MRVTRSRELVAEGYRPSAVARVDPLELAALDAGPRGVVQQRLADPVICAMSATVTPGHSARSATTPNTAALF